MHIHQEKQTSPILPPNEVALFSYLLSVWTRETTWSTQIPQEEMLPEDTSFTPESLFGSLYAEHPESCERILQRADWAAERLRAQIQETALVDATKELTFSDAVKGFHWIINCIPQVPDASGACWKYEAFDTKRFTQDEQYAKIFSNFITHSWVAGMVGYTLATKLNEQNGRKLIDENQVLWDLFTHEAGRAITHNRKAHDKLLPYIFYKAGVLPKYWPVEGQIHPRVLPVSTHHELALPQQQLQQIIEWVADMYCKSDDENAPYDTPNGKPQLRKADSGLQYMLFSMLGYDSVPENRLEQQKLWLSILSKNGAALYYLLEQQLISEVPHWFDRMGVSIQETLDQWQPLWQSLLHSLVTTQRFPQWLSKEDVHFAPESELYEDQPWVEILRNLPQVRRHT